MEATCYTCENDDGYDCILSRTDASRCLEMIHSDESFIMYGGDKYEKKYPFFEYKYWKPRFLRITREDFEV